MHVIELFDRGYSLDPAAPCFIDDATGRCQSYAETRELTLRIAQGLKAGGFAEETRAAVLSVNDALAFSCILGLMRAGLAWVPINPRNSLAENIDVLDRFKCEVLFYHSLFDELVDRIRKEVGGIRLFVCLDEKAPQAEKLADWVSEYRATEIEISRNPEALAMLIATGGTTGLPKGVMLSRKALFVAMAMMVTVDWYDDKPPVFLAAAPMTHAAGGLCFAILARGGAVVVQAAMDTQKVLTAIMRHNVTTVFLPPTVIYMLLSQPNVCDFDYSSLRHFIYGAAPISPDKLKEAMTVFGPVMTQIFGQTECLFPITYLSPRDHADALARGDDKRLSSCGKPSIFAQLAIMDEEGALLPCGEIGEIVVRSETVMTGYYDNPDLSVEIAKFGWHHTGDVEYCDADGFYYILDRLKDMIITGGFNVFSAEVERAVLSVPAIQDCAVIAVPDEKWGEAVKAVVELKPGCSVDAQTLIARCRELLGPVKAPKSVDVVAQLPRSSIGKVLKRVVRDQYWRGQERQVH